MPEKVTKVKSKQLLKLFKIVWYKILKSLKHWLICRSHDTDRVLWDDWLTEPGSSTWESYSNSIIKSLAIHRTSQRPKFRWQTSQATGSYYLKVFLVLGFWVWKLRFLPKYWLCSDSLSLRPTANVVICTRDLGDTRSCHPMCIPFGKGPFFRWILFFF